MKVIWLFYIGVGIDIIGLSIAIYMMLSDAIKGRSGTNNPTMFSVTLLLAALVLGGFLLQNWGKLILANITVWIPGFPLLLYGLFVLLIIIFKPDMR